MSVYSDDNEMIDTVFMREALRQAEIASDKDEVPVGAVITLDNRIIAKAYNQVESLRDPTAHAEMIAITQATNTIASKWLYDCTIYVTLEPCSMCAGALVLARIKRICFCADDPKTGACGSVFNIVNSDKLNHKIEINKIPMEGAGAQLLSEFFRNKR